MKVLKSIIIILVAIISAIIIIGFGAAYFYGDKIQDIAIEELNKSLETKLDIESVDVSFLENLPYVSVILENVYLKSIDGFNSSSFKEINTDTLLFAKTLTLNFDVYKAVNNIFILKKLTISDGKVNILTDSKGKDNYHFLEENLSNDTSSLNINLKSVTLDKIRLTVINKSTKFASLAVIKNAKLSGIIKSDDIQAKSKIDALVVSFISNEDKYISNLPFKSELEVRKTEDRIIVKSGNIDIHDLRMKLNGDYLISSSKFENFHFASDIISLQNLYTILPKKIISNELKDNTLGLVSFKGTINGSFNDWKGPRLELNYALDNGVLKFNNLKEVIKNISSSGVYNGDLGFTSNYSKLTIEKLDLRINDDKFINGKLKIVNPNSPRITGQLDIDLNLEILNTFKVLEEDQFLSGDLSGQITFKGLSTDYDKIFTDDLIWAGDVSLNNLEYGKSSSNPDFIITQSKLSLNGKDVGFEETKVIYDNNTYSLNGIIHEPIASYKKDQPYKISSYIESEKVIISTSESSADDFDLVSNIDLKGNISIKELVYDRVIASNISSSLSYNINTIHLPNLSFKIVNGDIKSKLTISQADNNNISISGFADLNEIDIHEFFYSFRDFGQTFLQSKHFTGDLSGKIYFDTKWDPQLNLFEDDLLIESSVEVMNGELFEFEPMMELSNYLRVPDLEHIQFSNLKNDIVIQNKQVFIPMMEINSTAMNINISGIHDFEQNISYDITLLLSDLLSKRFKTDKPKDWEEYTDESLQTKIYLTINGNVDDFEIKYDFKKAKEVRKENRQEEKQELKAVLHKEFGLFKKDSVELNNVLKAKDEKKKPKVKIIWDEDAEEEENEDPF